MIISSRDVISLEGQGSTTSHPRRCSSPASCSVGISRSNRSAFDNLGAGSAGATSAPSDSDFLLQPRDQLVRLDRVNFPAAWRWVNCIGPRASRKLRVTCRVQEVEELVHLT